MKSVAIVEDEREEAALLNEYLQRYGGEKGEIFKADVYGTGVTFLTDYKPEYDIVFMDIDLPDLDGMKVAGKLRELDKKVMIVFVTNMAKFAVKGYEVAAFDFIVKPVSYGNFAMKLDRALASLRAKESKYILISSGDSKMRLDTAGLTYVEVIKHKLIFHTFDGSVESYGTLKKTEETLNDPLFVRCNNCYLVNLRFVSALQGAYAVVAGDKLLVSYPRRAKFEKALTDYLCGGEAGDV